MPAKTTKQTRSPQKRGQGTIQANKGQVTGGASAPAGQELAAQDARKAARSLRQAEARAAAERRRRAAALRRMGIIGAIAVAALAVVVVFILQEAGKPGQSVAQQPSPHIPSVDSPHTYDSDPPTSGPHLGGTAPWGVSSTPITKELQVHNLEDGGVIVNYRPDLDKTTVDRLADLVRTYPSDVLMAPYPGLSEPIVLTSWNRIDRLQGFDEARLRRFINEYRGKDHHRESGS